MKAFIWKFALISLIVSLALAMLAPLASQRPDGLDRVVEDHASPLTHAHSPGDAAPAAYFADQAPLPDYTVPGWGEKVGKIAAGLAGVLGTFAVGYGLSWLLGRGRKSRPIGKPAGETSVPR